MRFRRITQRIGGAVTAFVATVTATTAAGVSSPSPVGAQTPVATAIAPVNVGITPIVAHNANLNSLPTGPQVMTVTFANTGTAPVTNTQTVVRAGVSPAYIVSVLDGFTPLGSIDAKTGLWYATIVQLPGNGIITLTVTWQQPCPGKWPVSARFGDRSVVTLFLTFLGPADSKCPLEDASSSQPATISSLPWPPSLTASVGTATTLPVVTSSSVPLVPVPAGAALPTTTTTTFPAAVTVPTTGGGSAAGSATTTTALIQPVNPGTAVTPTPAAPATTLAPGATSTTSPSVNPAVTVTPPLVTFPTLPTAGTVGSTPTTLLSLGAPSTVPAATTTAPTRASTPVTRRATTTVIVCRTVNGERICGPRTAVTKTTRATTTTKSKRSTTTKKSRSTSSPPNTTTPRTTVKAAPPRATGSTQAKG